jgi:putative restriction endonuclease
MPALSDIRLRQLILSSLPGSREIGAGTSTKPILLEVPSLGAIRIYLWTTTPDRSAVGRPAGEHKAQIILPGTGRGCRQHLLTGDITTALLGYSPVFGIFSAWQAEKHQNSGYSKNLQFQEELLVNAVAFGWAVGVPRLTDAGPEVRVAFHPVHLEHYLRVLRDADAQSLNGEARRTFFVINRPPRVPDPVEVVGETPAQQERRRVMTARLQRDSAFSRNVAVQYGGSCAVCAVQLSVTEGAHIIPVHDNRSTDDVWNGICLCANHHRLYDNRILRITQDAVIQQNVDEVNVLRELGLLAGHETIVAPFLGRTLRLPNFYHINADFRGRFHTALRLMDIH